MLNSVSFFFQETYGLLSSIQELLQKMRDEKIHVRDLYDLLRLVHTVKGNVAHFPEGQSLAGLLHDWETHLGSCHRLKVSQSQEYFDSVHRQFSEIVETLGGDRNALLPKNMSLPAQLGLQHLHTVHNNLCTELGTQCELRLHCEEFLLQHKVVAELSHLCTQLLINSLVHGVEQPGERAWQQKPETGTISISLRKQKEQVLLVVQDDGRGLPPDFDEKILQDGFSTASAITKNSGRGMGLSLLKRFVHDHKAELRIDSEPRQGLRIELAFAPKPKIGAEASVDQVQVTKRAA